MGNQDRDPMDDTIGQALRRIREIQDYGLADYDGLVGSPPGWMPDSEKAEFEQARSQLLSAHSVEAVREWLSALRKFQLHQQALCAQIAAADGDSDATPVPSIDFPLEYHAPLSALLRIQDRARKNERDGIREYLGPGAEQATRRLAASEVAKRSRPRPLTKAIEDVLRDRPEATYEEVYRALPSTLLGSLQKPALQNRISRARGRLGRRSDS